MRRAHLPRIALRYLGRRNGLEGTTLRRPCRFCDTLRLCVRSKGGSYEEVLGLHRVFASWQRTPWRSDRCTTNPVIPVNAVCFGNQNLSGDVSVGCGFPKKRNRSGERCACAKTLQLDERRFCRGSGCCLSVAAAQRPSRFVGSRESPNPNGGRTKPR